MSTSHQELSRLLETPREGSHIEFKEAARSYDFEKLADYCSAFANEGGGLLILGVSDHPPRCVVGTQAFPNTDKIRRRLYDRMHIRVEVEEIDHPDGRVVIFRFPPRPIGTPIADQGTRHPARQRARG